VIFYTNILYFHFFKASEVPVSSGKGFSAGGQHLKRRLPSTTAASPEFSYPARSCLPMSALLIGADDFLQPTPLPEQKTQNLPGSSQCDEPGRFQKFPIV